MRDNYHFSCINGDATPPLPLAGLKVLVVDDDEDSRFYVSIVLEQEGAIVTMAASVTQAMELVTQFQPDVLVSDIGMPVEDGYSLIRQIRALNPDEGGNIPAIALTAYADSEDRLLALQAGFQTHMPKPVNPEELVAVVTSVAGYSRGYGDI